MASIATPDKNVGRVAAVEVLAPSMAKAKEIQESLAKLPEVSRTISLDTFIPEDQPAKLAINGGFNLAFVDCVIFALILPFFTAVACGMPLLGDGDRRIR